MTKANVLALDYTEPSPCLTCSRHLAGLDKNRCVRTCQKIMAYRNGKPYDEIELSDELDDLDDLISDQQGIKQVPTKQKSKKRRNNMPKVEKATVKGNESINEIVDSIAKKVEKKAIKKITRPKDKPAEKERHSIPIKLYLTRYPKIKEFLNELSEAQGLPQSHIVLSLIGEVIMKRGKEGKDVI